MDAFELDQRFARERQFHDALASQFHDGAHLPLEPPGEPEAAMYAAAHIKPGDRVLDVGCGTGDVTLHLGDMGAQITALDLSPGVTRLAAQRLKAFRPEAPCTFRAAPVEDSGLPDESFDVLIGRYVLDHVDVKTAAPELVRLLVPGGRAIFPETSARNRLLMLARRHLAGRLGIPRFGTPDEQPLTDHDISILAEPFARAEVSYPVFEFLRIFDRQVPRFRWRSISRALRAADHFVERRIPMARPYSFRVFVTLWKDG